MWLPIYSTEYSVCWLWLRKQLLVQQTSINGARQVELLLFLCLYVCQTRKKWGKNSVKKENFATLSSVDGGWWLITNASEN